ncbi:MAG: hypothetical protein P0S96_00305 [Simkaniaceae bacterium]|nr:hypothetical protein [Candidatus Sacchlamyda saccharinae]
MHILEKIILFCRKHSIRFLSYALGIIYIWYGALKLLGISPAEELVYRATHWIGVHDFVTFLGFWEVTIGICFLVRKWLPVGILLFFLHFPGTFLPLFTNPEDCFTIIPYGLTLEGQYIFKNLLSLAAVLTILGSQSLNKISSKKTQPNARTNRK